MQLKSHFHQQLIAFDIFLFVKRLYKPMMNIVSIH